MIRLRGLLLSALLLTLAACEPSATETPTSAAAPPPAPVSEAPTGQENGRPATEDQETPRQAATAPAAASRLSVERNVHYEVITSARPRTSAEPIEVAEFFWYGCPHCYSFEPVVTRWKQQLPDDVAFVRVPVVWGADHERYARVYYTAEALGRLDEMHEQIFRDFHLDNRLLRNDRDVEAFFARFGISSREFQEAWNWFSVRSNLSNARRLTSPAGYNIQSTPILVVNGRYKVVGEAIRTFDDVLAVAGELIEQERQARLAESGG